MLSLFTERIRVTSIHEKLEPNGSYQRFLVIEDSSEFPGTIILIPFPEGRATLSYGDAIYDWNGRKVSIDVRIEKILGPYEPYADYDRPSAYKDRFLAKLKTGDFVIASLNYSAPSKIQDPEYTGSRYAITGGLLNRYPHISYDDSDIIEDGSSLFIYAITYERSISNS